MPRLATVVELKEHLDVQGEDALLSRLLDSAETIAERYARRRFSPDPPVISDPPVVRTFSLRAGATSLRIPDLRLLDVITVDGSPLMPGDYRMSRGGSGEPATHLYLRIGTFRRYSYHAEFDVVISGHWGFNPVPPDVRHAVLSTAARAYRARDAAYGDSVVIEGGGSLNYVRQMSEESKAILDSYRVPNLAVV